MELGVIGLGRMGRIVVDRTLEAGHDVVAFDLDDDAVESAAEAGATPADSIADLAAELGDDKRIWLMVPAGTASTPPSTISIRTSPPTTWWSTAATRSSSGRSTGPKPVRRRISTAGPAAAPPVPRKAFR